MTNITSLMEIVEHKYLCENSAFNLIKIDPCYFVLQAAKPFNHRLSYTKGLALQYLGIYRNENPSPCHLIKLHIGDETMTSGLQTL